MSAARQREIFDAAVEIADEGERRRLLDRACAGDPPLRAKVEELLAARERAESFFIGCQAAVVASGRDLLGPAGIDTGVNKASVEEFDDALGSRIGPYKLLQNIGEGGCGVVYMAEQEKPVRRRVALKIIKLGMDTRNVIARFDAERQALAMMDHPNIARVLDAGATETGRPYFVMELVRGVKITDVLRRKPTRHPPAVGIVHRDLPGDPARASERHHSPGHQAVEHPGDDDDGEPVPKVIDFGIAKAMEERLTD